MVCFWSNNHRIQDLITIFFGIEAPNANARRQQLPFEACIACDGHTKSAFGRPFDEFVATVLGPNDSVLQEQFVLDVIERGGICFLLLLQKVSDDGNGNNVSSPLRQLISCVAGADLVATVAQHPQGLPQILCGWQCPIPFVLGILMNLL